jgi:hypothetical protein
MEGGRLKEDGDIFLKASEEVIVEKSVICIY